MPLKPTSELRFIQRPTDFVLQLRAFEPADMGKGQADSIERLMRHAADEIMRCSPYILQQKWVVDRSGVANSEDCDEWRNVPIIEELANASR